MKKTQAEKTQEMNDFNLRHSKLNYDEFMNRIIENREHSDLAKYYEETFTEKGFGSSTYSQLITMKSRLRDLKTNDIKLSSRIAELLLQVQTKINTHLDQQQ